MISIRQNMPKILRILKLHFFSVSPEEKKYTSSSPRPEVLQLNRLHVLSFRSRGHLRNVTVCFFQNLYSVQAPLLISLQLPALSQITLKLPNKQVPYTVTVCVAQNY